MAEFSFRYIFNHHNKNNNTLNILMIIKYLCRTEREEEKENE